MPVSQANLLVRCFSIPEETSATRAFYFLVSRRNETSLEKRSLSLSLPAERERRGAGSAPNDRSDLRFVFDSYIDSLVSTVSDLVTIHQCSGRKATDPTRTFERAIVHKVSRLASTTLKIHNGFQIAPKNTRPGLASWAPARYFILRWPGMSRDGICIERTPPSDQLPNSDWFFQKGGKHRARVAPSQVISPRRVRVLSS